MGLEVLFWIAVLTWMAKRSAEDVLHAVKGTPNPRYEMKKAKALAAGQPAPEQPRYGGKDWWADFTSDAMAANTHKRRAKAKAKAQPVDDMIGLTREPRQAPSKRQPAPRPHAEDEPASSVVHDGTSTSTKNAGKWAWSCRKPGCAGKGFDYDTEEQARDAATQHRCKGSQTLPPEGVQITGPGKPTEARTTPPPSTGGQPTLATVIPMFPIMKESTMANAEITGLPTAIAFAQGMASAHRAASTAGGEQYVASLRSFEVGDGAIATVATARELSAQAAAAWDRAAAEIAKGNVVKEAYQAVPDAGNKQYLLGE